MRYRIQLEAAADFEDSCDMLDHMGFKIIQRTPTYQKLIIDGPSHLAEQLVQIDRIYSISPIKEVPLPA